MFPLLAVTIDDETAEDLARLEDSMDGNPPVTLIVDSGADFHVVGNRDLLIDIVGSSKKLRTAKGEDLGVVGYAENFLLVNSDPQSVRSDLIL